MNKPLLFGFIGIMVVVLGLPLLAQFVKEKPAGGVAAPDAGGYTAPPANSGPALTAGSIVGSTWRVATSRGPVTATFNAGGALSAQHALAGSINGTWQISGNQVTLNASAFGQAITIPLQISGSNLLFEGKPAERLN